MSHKLYIPLFILLTFSCTKQIQLDLPPYSSKIVVNGEANTDNFFSFQVSRSLPIMQSSDSSGYLLQNARVIIRQNGIPIDTAVYFSGMYVSDRKPIAGNNYEIVASAPGYNAATATVTIPNQLLITTSYVDSVGVDALGIKFGQIYLSFTDNASIQNYYRLLIRYYDADILTWFPLEITSTDIIFLNNEKLNDGSYIFSDRTFSGKTKSLNFRVPFGLATGTPKFEVSVKNFSEDYFTYLRQTDEYNQDGNGISNDPVILRSNVINGLGMVGGVSNARDTI